MRKKQLFAALALCLCLSVTVPAQAAGLPGEKVPGQSEEMPEGEQQPGEPTEGQSEGMPEGEQQPGEPTEEQSEGMPEGEQQSGESTEGQFEGMPEGEQQPGEYMEEQSEGMPGAEQQPGESTEEQPEGMPEAEQKSGEPMEGERSEGMLEAEKQSQALSGGEQQSEAAGTMLMAVAGAKTFKPYADAKYELLYSVKNGSVTINGLAESGAKGEGQLVIPDEIEGMPVTEIGYGAFRDCSGFTGELVLSKNLTKIQGYAFAGCGGLTGNLNLPQNLTYMGIYVFDGCSGFTGSLNLPQGLTEINMHAFSSCRGFTSLVLPEKVTAIGMQAFWNCRGFTGELVLPEGLTKIGYDAFGECRGFSGVLTLPKSLVNIDKSFETWSDRMEVRLTEGATSVTCLDEIFVDMYDVEINLYVPRSVTEMSIPENCFIYGYPGSAAEQYAQSEGRVFVPMGTTPQIETYTVGTAEELLGAVGSYRRIILKDGLYTLPDSLGIKEQVFLTLEAEHDGMAEILVENGQVPVILVEKSAEIEIKGCILGHDSIETTETCGGMDSEAYVIWAKRSNDVRVSGCDLYGCGFIGVYCEYVQGLSVDKCVIRDCQTYAVYSSVRGDNHEIVFEGCIISGNGKLNGRSSVAGGWESVFRNDTFLNNHNRILSAETYGSYYDSRRYVAPVFENCRYYDNAWQEKTPGSYGICLNGITWEVADGTLKLGYPLAMEDGTVIESAKGKVLDYSDSSLPWKDYLKSVRGTSTAEGIQYDGGGATEPGNDPGQTPGTPGTPGQTPDTPGNPDASVPEGYNGWYEAGGREYWYENGVRQGTEGRGKEIYDPQSDAWYWLDAVSGGARAVDKDVYQESSGGKWVRYDGDGRMVKGEDFRNGGWYYFEPVTGTMMKGAVTLEDGRKVFYDTTTGQMVLGAYTINGQAYYFDETDGHLVEGEESNFWVNVDGRDYWYEGWQRQGWNPGDVNYRGKEIYDPASDAWYWLDNVNQGAKAVSKDVYQESYSAYPDREDGTGKWVRYDADGHMVKGWQETEGGTWYFEEITGAMAKGLVSIGGVDYRFDDTTGILQ